jgi:predicted DNA-binding transcriptional regulator YafY
MSTQDQARALASRHQHIAKNREQSALSRMAAEIGVSSETAMRNQSRNVGMS